VVDLMLPLAAETDFLTSTALGTFTGASVATVVVGNTARYLTKRDLRVVPFVFALVFAYVAAQITGNPRTLSDVLLVLLNGCLLFCTAIGANQVLVSVASQPGGIAPHGRPRSAIRWLQSWYPVGDPAGSPETPRTVQRAAPPQDGT
jgi:hypothetical protein